MGKVYGHIGPQSWSQWWSGRTTRGQSSGVQRVATPMENPVHQGRHWARCRKLSSSSRMWSPWFTLPTHLRSVNLAHRYWSGRHLLQNCPSDVYKPWPRSSFQRKGTICLPYQTGGRSLWPSKSANSPWIFQCFGVSCCDIRSHIYFHILLCCRAWIRAAPSISIPTYSSQVPVGKPRETRTRGIRYLVLKTQRVQVSILEKLRYLWQVPVFSSFQIWSLTST